MESFEECIRLLMTNLGAFNPEETEDVEDLILKLHHSSYYNHGEVPSELMNKLALFKTKII